MLLLLRSARDLGFIVERTGDCNWGFTAAAAAAAVLSLLAVAWVESVVVGVVMGSLETVISLVASAGGSLESVLVLLRSVLGEILGGSLRFRLGDGDRVSRGITTADATMVVDSAMIKHRGRNFEIASTGIVLYSETVAEMEV